MIWEPVVSDKDYSHYMSLINEAKTYHVENSAEWIRLTPKGHALYVEANDFYRSVMDGAAYQRNVALAKKLGL